MECTLVPHVFRQRFQLWMKYHQGAEGVIEGCISEMTVKGGWLSW